MDIEKFEVFAFTGKPLNEHELGDELAKLLEIRQALEVAAFNDKVLDLTERLLWTRQEVKYRERKAAIVAKTKIKTWCEAECTFHQFHSPNGTPIDWDGNPIPVAQPPALTPLYCADAARVGAPRCNDMECEVCS